MTIDGLPAYSTLEVARHNSINDVWIIVNGKVLDISSWLIEHPGGDVILLDQAGKRVLFNWTTGVRSLRTV